MTPCTATRRSDSSTATTINYCFLPLYVFCGDELLRAYLAPAISTPASTARAVLELLVNRLRDAWPEVKITIRADSGFCRWRLMWWCDSHGIGYILGLAKNPVLDRAGRDEIDRAERQFQQPASPSGSSARSPTAARVGIGSGG